MQHADDDRLAFAPPPQPGLVRAFGLAVIAHLLLAFALMHGLQWQRESENVVAEAELWSATPREAAPKEVPVPPPPVVKAPPKPEPPVVKAPPQPEPPLRRDADIALEREKQRRELEKQKQAELEKREREERRKLEAQKKREEELARRKQEQAKQVAEAKRKEEERKRKQQEQEEREAKRLAELREENMKRIQGMAGTGAPGSRGSAAQSSGPSASWGGKVQAKVMPLIVFTEMGASNPRAEVEVRLAPDGTIVGKRIVRSSGVKAWDEAVLRALEKAETLPRDIDGRVPSSGTISFSPRKG